MGADKKPQPSTFDNFWEERLKDYPNTSEFKSVYDEMLGEMLMPERKLKTPVVVSMIGVPGTGKSTFSKLLQEFIPSAHLRSDIIGLSKLPQGPDHDYYKAYVIQHALAHYFLGQGYSVIMDDNNRTQYNRERDYRMAKEYGARNILFYLRLPLEEALRRARQRDLKEGRSTNFHQTKEALLRFQSQIEEPTPDEITKWNIIYRETDTGKSLEELINHLAQDKELQKMIR